MIASCSSRFKGVLDPQVRVNTRINLPALPKGKNQVPAGLMDRKWLLYNRMPLSSLPLVQHNFQRLNVEFVSRFVHRLLILEIVNSNAGIS